MEPAAQPGACSARPFQWSEPEIYLPSLTRAEAVRTTTSGNALSVLFDGLEARLDTPDLPLSRTTIATLRVPVTLPRGQQLLGYVTDVRGSVFKDADTRVSLLLDLGGTARHIEYPYGETREDAAKWSLFSLVRLPAPGGPPDAPGPGPCVLSLVITVERRVPQAAVALTLDSVDIVATLTPLEENPVDKPTHDPAVLGLLPATLGGKRIKAAAIHFHDDGPEPQPIRLVPAELVAPSVVSTNAAANVTVRIEECGGSGGAAGSVPVTLVFFDANMNQIFLEGTGDYQVDTSTKVATIGFVSPESTGQFWAKVFTTETDDTCAGEQMRSITAQ